MSDDLEVRFSMSRKRRGSYDVEYMRIVVGLIRDGIGAKSLARRLGVSKETTREWLLCVLASWRPLCERCFSAV